ncbi:HTH_Tnp_Tc3_2 domain-containing protein [Trichonephila clavipes]|nr:HTH_Tnp_Tc3_2 domain-containing protein [Trichonephila clavipes]
MPRLQKVFKKRKGKYYPRKNTINSKGKRILNAAKLVYEDSIQNAAKEAICENKGNKNIAVAVDGTWQKRGYTSLNGVVIVTSIDIGSAIRRNLSSVQNMRQAIWAIFLHKLSTDEYPQHGFCPIGEDSWCGFKKAEPSAGSIPGTWNRPESVISRLSQRFQHDGNVSRCYNTGCPRVTRLNELRYLALTAKRKRRSAASDLSSQLSSATGTTVSRQTVYRRVGHIGLYAHRPVRCVPHTATHCRLRLYWSREHALWTP